MCVCVCMYTYNALGSDHVKAQNMERLASYDAHVCLCACAYMCVCVCLSTIITYDDNDDVTNRQLKNKIYKINLMKFTMLYNMYNIICLCLAKDMKEKIKNTIPIL